MNFLVYLFNAFTDIGREFTRGMSAAYGYEIIKLFRFFGVEL